MIALESVAGQEVDVVRVPGYYEKGAYLSVRMPSEVLHNKKCYYLNKSREVLSQWFNYFNKDPDAQFLCPAILDIDFISKPVSRQKKKFPEFPQQTSVHVSLARICSLVHFQNEQ